MIVGSWFVGGSFAGIFLEEILDQFNVGSFHGLVDTETCQISLSIMTAPSKLISFDGKYSCFKRAYSLDTILQVRCLIPNDINQEKTYSGTADRSQRHLGVVQTCSRTCDAIVSVVDNLNIPTANTEF